MRAENRFALFLIPLWGRRSGGLGPKGRCVNAKRLRPDDGQAKVAAMSLPLSESVPAPAGLLHQRSFLFFWVGRFLTILAAQAQTVTIAWQVYGVARGRGDVRQAAFAVGLIGLAQFLPVFVLALPAGGAADRHDRRTISLICQGVEVVTASALAVIAYFGLHAIWPIFGIAVVFGASRAFLNPANTALGPMLVPKFLLPKAVAWNSLAWQSASILGPAVGGLLCAISPAVSFSVSAGLYLAGCLSLFLVSGRTRPAAQSGSRWTLAKEGLHYVYTHKIVFGSMSLDLFAVLLGGATALLPVYARDVLRVGPAGFGVLRAGPAIGACAVAVLIATRPIQRKAGLVMFAGVAVFGAATVVFALSRWLALSVAALVVLGAADMLSVYVRQSLVQIATPDAMRGRVAAVSSLFIGASNELGEFESGVAARILGPIGAAVFGGVGALVVTGVWAKLFPELRKADRLG
jgi:MFS family permease